MNSVKRDDQFVQTYALASYNGKTVAFYGVRINNDGTEEALIADISRMKTVPVKDVAVYSRKKTDKHLKADVEGE